MQRAGLTANSRRRRPRPQISPIYNPQQGGRIKVLQYLGTWPLPKDRYGDLSSIRSSTEGGELLYTEDGTSIPILNRQKLFILKCYHQLCKIIIDLAYPKNPDVLDSERITLTGTPGIEKSSF